MEQVLVVNRQDLETQLSGFGFITQNIENIHQFILDHYTFMNREKAEYDNTVKQIIPYVIIRQGKRYFLLKRLKKQTEKRLHHKLSLGVGGHINPTEKTAADPLEAGLMRELHEEVFIETIQHLTCIGVINENNGSVSDYHTALVYLLDAEGFVSVRETEKMSGNWANPETLSACCSDLESWSELIVKELILKEII